MLSSDDSILTFCESQAPVDTASHPTPQRCVKYSSLVVRIFVNYLVIWESHIRAQLSENKDEL